MTSTRNLIRRLLELAAALAFGEVTARTPGRLATRPASRRRVHAAALTTLGVGLVLSALTVHSVRGGVESDARARFERLVDRLVSELEHRVNLSVYGLNGAHGLYAAADVVGREAFRTYVRSRDLANEFPGALGFGFIKRVMRRDLDAFVAAEGADGAPGFAVHTSGDAADLYVITTIEPLERNLASVGYDVGSEPIHRAAIESAVATGRPTLSGGLALLQDDDPRPPFLYMVPIYHGAMHPETAEQRWAALEGVVYAPLMIDEVLASVAPVADGRVHLDVFDGSETARADLLFCSSGAHDARETLGSEADADYETRTSLRGGNHVWTVRARSTERFAELERTPRIALVGLCGAALSAMAAAVVWSLARGRAFALELAHAMTADLAAAKAQAEERETRFRTLVEGAQDMIVWEYDVEARRFTYVSPQAMRLGYRLSDWLRTDFWRDTLHPEDRERAVALCESQVASATAHRFQYRMLAADGSVLWIDDFASAPERRGDTTILRGVFVDVTQRMLAESLARQQAERLELTVRGAGLGTWDWNVATGDVAFNERFAHALGYEPGEIAEQRAWVDLIHPDDAQRVAKTVGAHLGGSTPEYRCEHRLRRKDGSYASVLSVGRVTERDADGRALRAAGVTVDTSEAREARADLAASERRVRAIIDTAMDAVVGMNEAGAVIDWNAQAEAVFGWTAAEAIGQPLHQLIIPEALRPDQQAGLERFRASGHGPMLGKRIEVPALRKDGSWLPVELSVNPIHTADGVTFAAFARDITTRRKMESDLVDAKNRAEAATRAKTEFLANMSHEIRTPLTAILGYADLLREEGDSRRAPEGRLQSIETIRNAGQHLLTIINDILDLSKIEAGKLTIEAVVTPLARLLGEVESLMSARAANKGVALGVILATPIPDRVMSDPTRLRQVLMNLAGNACKFTERGTVTLTTQVSGEFPDARLVVDVEDTGAGMTPDQADRLFVAFSQADATVTRQHGGTGLGLTISRRLARLMGGDVTLEWTEPGRGSRFRAVFPLVRAQGAMDVTQLDAVLTTVPAFLEPLSIDLTGRVLLAEDGISNQRLIAHHLRKVGALVDVAENGRAALEHIDKAEKAGQPYDLLISDMQMPEIDGYTLARMLRQRGSTIAIIALTAHAMPEDRQKCLDAGCDDYASKPIDKSALLRSCSRWIGVPGGAHASKSRS